MESPSPNNNNNSSGSEEEEEGSGRNWLTGVVLPKLATGAANILSSFILTPVSSSSSSSSSSDSDHDYALTDSGDNEGDQLIKENGNTSALGECLRKESQLTIGKSETKNLIEKLVVQETFSREERDCLISIINSRVIINSTGEEGQAIRSDVPDSCTKAILEAKQWIEENKEASNSKLKQAHGISPLKSVMLSQDNKGELGSPVDLAKAYMRDRPPWSSLSRKSAGEQTPSSVGREVLTPYGSSVSSSKRKFSSLSSASWNIQDEIRRVRSKATEEILKTVPSQKYNTSSYVLEPEGIQNTLPFRRIEFGLGDKLHDSNLFPSVTSTDASSDFMVGGVSTSGYLSASAADISQDNSLTENLQLQPVTVAGTQNAEEIQMVEEDKHAAHGHHDIQKPVLEDDLRLRGKAIDSGFASSGVREIEKHPQPTDDRNKNSSSSREETCQLLSESFVEVPSMDEIYDEPIDNSLSNSTKLTEESSKTSTRLNLKQGAKAKTTTNLEKALGRKMSRFNKKARGKD